MFVFISGEDPFNVFYVCCKANFAFGFVCSESGSPSIFMLEPVCVVLSARVPIQLYSAILGTLVPKIALCLIPGVKSCRCLLENPSALL